VWLHEYLEDFPGKQDVLRYVLTANMPETKDNDFTWKDFQARNNNELVAILGNFVNRALVLTHKYFEGKLPEMGPLTDYDKSTIEELPKLKASIEKNLESFRFRDALREMMNIARLGNKYLADSEPWKIYKTNPHRVATILNVSLQICANIAILAEPFLPFTSEKLRRMLSTSAAGWTKSGNINLLPVGHQIEKAELLFEKIEDDVVESQLAKLKSTKMENQAKAKPIEPQKGTITFDDFTKMDIRISTVLAAERVPKTKKLLKLEIDTGIDKRTIVSGIAEFFKPEDVVGRQVCVLVNLEPRKIRGVLSHGMILMAKNSDDSLRFVEPNEAVDSGSSVN
jgi:methionyl-tRNA synthetase